MNREDSTSNQPAGLNSADERVPAKVWWAVTIFSLAGLVSTLDRKILGVLVDPVRLDLNITDTGISILQGASFSILYAAMTVPMGLLADRSSRRRLIIFGVSLWSGATLVGGFAASFGWLLVARMLVGIGEACLSPAVVSMIADLLPPAKRGRALSIFFMAQALGTGASIVIAGAILETWPEGAPATWPLLGGLAAWRLTFVVCGALGFIVVAGLGTIREPERQGVRLHRDTAEKYLPTFRYFTRYGWIFFPVYVGFAMLSVANYGMQAWSPALMMRKFGFTPGEVATWLGGITMIAGVLGAILGGIAADKLDGWGRRDSKLLILIVACLVGVPGTLIVFAPGPWWVLAMLGFWIACFPVCGTVVVVALQDMVPQDARGVATSFVSLFATFIGFSLGSLLIALCTEYLYRDPAMVGHSITTVMLPSVIVGALLFAVAYRRLREALPVSAELRTIMGLTR